MPHAHESMTRLKVIGWDFSRPWGGSLAMPRACEGVLRGKSLHGCIKVTKAKGFGPWSKRRLISYTWRWRQAKKGPPRGVARVGGSLPLFLPLSSLKGKAQGLPKRWLLLSLAFKAPILFFFKRSSKRKKLLIALDGALTCPEVNDELHAWLLQEGPTCLHTPL